MQVKIIRQPRLHLVRSFYLCFDSLNNPGGYSFPCSCTGEIDILCLSLSARRNLQRCLTGEGVGPGIIKNYSHRWVSPRVGLCDCGAEVVLDHFTSTCDACGADYNSSGQLLAPREQWGYETGEHWVDVANVQ